MPINLPDSTGGRLAPPPLSLSSKKPFRWDSLIFQGTIMGTLESVSIANLSGSLTRLPRPIKEWLHFLSTSLGNISA